MGSLVVAARSAPSLGERPPRYRRYPSDQAATDVIGGCMP